MLRNISLSNCWVARVNGGAPPHCGTVAIGDVDSDGQNELVIGTSQGTVNVLKATSTLKILCSYEMGSEFGVLSNLVVGRFLPDSMTVAVASITGKMAFLQIHGLDLQEKQVFSVMENISAVAIVPTSTSKSSCCDSIVVGTQEGLVSVVHSTESASLSSVDIGFFVTNIKILMPKKTPVA